jgi:hypothetical protein
VVWENEVVKRRDQPSGSQCWRERVAVRVHRAVLHVSHDFIGFEAEWRAALSKNEIWRKALLASAGLLIAAGCTWAIGKSISTLAMAHLGIDSLSASDVADVTGSVGAFSGVRTLTARGVSSRMIGEADFPASIVAARWHDFGSESFGTRGTDSDWLQRSRPSLLARFAALEASGPPTSTRSRIAPEPFHPRIPLEGQSKTALIDFETAPFPYDGKAPPSNRAFLDAGGPGHRGHTGSHGRILWASETFNDRRVLLHIPPAFDASRPGVMIVFFHGHGASLARDVRDRQQVPAQISASGANVVLVAPQFAVNAADSSAGKFWEPGGFKRFVGEAAEKLARLHGDPRTARAFADMPIVIVAYSGGFGPTLSVLERGGVNSRLRGLVLLDAIYGGLPKFANWIANNRSAFFISSYTPHNRSRTVELEQMLSDKSVPYSLRLRPGHLPGTVAFLSAGAISHRDFVNRAWVESPVKDILVRLDERDPRVETAANAPAPGSFTAAALPTR